MCQPDKHDSEGNYVLVAEVAYINLKDGRTLTLRQKTTITTDFPALGRA